MLDQAISCDDGYWAAEIIQDALGIESDEVANHCFPKTCPPIARIIGDWLHTKPGPWPRNGAAAP